MVQNGAASSSIPVPSVFVDGRGEIHNLQVGTTMVDARKTIDTKQPEGTQAAGAASTSSSSLRRTRYNVLYTSAGMMRSGDVHRETQHDFVLEGLVDVWVLEKDGTTRVRRYGPNSYVSVPPCTPHVFEFVQDTAMVEWWDTDAFAAWYYRPYRDIVDANNNRRLQRQHQHQTGRLVRYHVDEESTEGGDSRVRFRSILSLPRRAGSAPVSWQFVLGLAAGMAVGIAVGGRDRIER
jgi:hypothetical protein